MDTDPSIKSEIERIIKHMSNLEVDSEEYEKCLKRLKSLHEMKKNTRVSSDAILGAAVNIVGILLVLNHERLNVISSKAFTFIRRSS